MSSRAHDAADAEGEWCGTPAQVLAQRRLFEQRHQLASDGGLVSQGRTLMIMDAGTRPYVQILDLIRQFRRVLVFGEAASVSSLGARFRAENMRVQDDLRVLAGPADVVAARVHCVEHETTLPTGWHFDCLGPDAPAEWTSAVQALHLASGLAPLPGWFLRGRGGGTRTILLKSEAQRIVGCATALDLSSTAGREPQRLGMVLSVCLEPTARGRRLSPVLNLKALSVAIDEFGAEQLWEIVEPGNDASFAMNARSGLSATQRGCLFVESHLSVVDSLTLRL